ncbi:hypothetical protein F4777DRAFT_340206 [Nemania sp. FL0916]|nr:hypothetical protein F4777DRAFT_340206 [Nemania sp. FL0916]
MQPLYGGTSCAVTRTLVRNCRATRNVCSLRGQSHGGILPARRHASSRASNPSKRPVAKPLPYQPAQPKTPNVHAQKQQPQQPKQQRQPRHDGKERLSDLMRQRWFAMFGYGTALACLGYFTASLAMYWRREPAPCYPLGCEPETPTGRPSLQSPYEFDLHLDKSEWRYGITKLRRQMGAKVRGHVLEVAIGTGRNLEFIPWDAINESLLTPEERKKAKEKSSSWFPSWGGKDDKTSGKDDGAPVLSFTGVDISPGMLDITLLRARQAIPHLVSEIPKKPSFAIFAAKNGVSENPQGHVVSFLSDRLRLLQADVQSALPAPPTLSPLSPSNTTRSSTASLKPQKYDTIMQTFGLCSVHDPVALLSLMASSVQPNTGRILLLEHGRSFWDFVNGLLDRGARGHHERFGCWWNRDIEVIINEAARRIPGLEILRLERPGWATVGTHVVVELRVKDSDVESEVKTKERKKKGWASVIPPLLSWKPTNDPKGE